ncbi:MAG: S41 family peptidase [Gemmatimonadales bacterium]|jgi:C-terminal processing protease CtpA/Prc
MRRPLLILLGCTIALGGAAPRRPRGQDDTRPLTQRSELNLVAFTRLLGYVRYFYPTDVAVAEDHIPFRIGATALSHPVTDWDAFAVRVLPTVENAPDPASLEDVLNRLFQPIAPTIAVYLTGEAPPALLPAPASPTLGLVFWQHLGLGSSTPSVYFSVQRFVAAPGGKPPAYAPILGYPSARSDSIPIPDPSRPLERDLGGGVSASIPLAVYSTSNRLPETSPARGDGMSDSTVAPDRATRLAVVACLWNVAQHFYPYFDVVRTNWDSILPATLAAAATEADPDRFYAVLQRMVAALHDGHGWVYSARNEVLQRFYAHAPVRLGLVEGRIVVTGLEDSAVAAGVHLGEEVVSVDGRPARSVLVEQEALTSGATAGFVQFVALRQMLVGPPGSVVTLGLRDPFDARSAVHMVRLVRIRGPMRFGGLPEKVAQLRDGIVYVDFSRLTDSAFAGALPRLEHASGIVIDMRSYPSFEAVPALGMLSDAPLHSAPFLIPVVTTPDHQITHYLEGGWSVPVAAVRLKARAAFLIGPGMVSAGETIMGIVEAYQLGAMVGSTTAGTNGNVVVVTLPGGYRFRFTGMRVLKHDGSALHGVGIHPTIPVEPSLRGVWDGRDEVLERAVSWLVTQH